jgi:hypothetical protein
MYTQVTKSAFIDAFSSHDRLSNFGHEGLSALFDYLQELEDCAGYEFELDVIALCCDYTRFDSLRYYNEQYGTDYDDRYDIEEIACAIDDDAFICYAH